ncbi:exosortase H-associated membrane protein [Desulfonatronovibrio magnus]|uniref:exosortase H-associated membrane protein n=1 Tax=Desulfonatronovibrio magnus TaxID=698827 RepID=UPI0005EB9F8A|nr:exosortase H-associated membrane protein [Desulfonatronovibrio magnus]
MNILRHKILSGFILRLLFWLPVSFTAWHVLAGSLIVPVGWFTSLWLELFAAGQIESLSASDRMLNLETNLQVTTQDGQTGYLLFQINPLSYCWNLPLLSALTLSTGIGYMSWLRLAGGFIILLPFQAWGVAFEFLKLTTIQYGPDIAEQMGYGALGREFVALGYQFGFLMLPVISTSATWIAMHRWFIRQIVSER